MKKYKMYEALMKAIREGRVEIPAGYELRVESRGGRILSQEVVPC